MNHFAVSQNPAQSSRRLRVADEVTIEGVRSSDASARLSGVARPVLQMNQNTGCP